ncbi:MAG: efflux RND transporter periplasmic adaptor subunit, partial [Ekhidna sp.]
MKRKRTQYILSSIGVVILLLALFTSFYPAGSQEGSSKERGLEKFQVTHPVKKDTSFVAEYIASLQAIQHVELRSRIKGVIEKIHIDEGQLVKKNDILFTLSQQEFETELLQAKAALNSAIAEKRSAEGEMKNTKELVDKGIESPTQLEIAEARIDALQAKVEEARSFEEQAKLHLNYTTVRAPFDGVIGRIPNKVGSLEEEGTLLTTISDNSQMYAYFNVSEKEYLKLTAEQKDTNDEKVTLLLANQKAYEHQGKIQTLDN